MTKTEKVEDDKSKKVTPIVASKVKVVKVSKLMLWPSRKVNLGNYNTVDLNAGLEIVFEKPISSDSKELQEAFTTARQIIKQEFTEQFAPYRKKLIDDKKVVKKEEGTTK